MTHPGVFRSAEFRRIRDLPTRPQEWSPQDLTDAVQLLTEEFRTATGTMTLKPIQARALAEALDYGRLVAEIGAGLGKCLLSLLVFSAWNAKRGLLLVPALLVPQTLDQYRKLSKHWRLQPCYNLDPRAVVGPHVRVLSYQSLSTVRYAGFLEEYQPDVIVADEAHFLSRKKSSRGRQTFRYLKKTRAKFVPLSGTMRRKSIKECAALYEAALWEHSPFPLEYGDLEQWSMAIDEGVRDDARIPPGALADFSEGADDLASVRRGIRQRLISTPGVIATSESGVDCSLVLQVRDVTVPDSVKAAMVDIREHNRLPTGETFDAGVTAWNHAREVAGGFAYRWDPPAPPAWRKARSAWNEFVKLAQDHPPPGMHLDSPLQVANAIRAGHFGDPAKVGPYVDWAAIRDTFVPNPVPTWVDDFLVKDAEEWALKTGGIVWVGHTSAYTKAEAEGLTDEDPADVIGGMFKRIPYFGAGKAGQGIHTHRGPCVASIRSHGTGANLHYWNRGLILSLPSSGAALEQLLARLHRLGQRADEVLFEFYCHSREQLEALKTARRDAQYMEALNGNPQRVLYGTLLSANGEPFDPETYLPPVADPMWQVPKKAPEQKISSR